MSFDPFHARQLDRIEGKLNLLLQRLGVVQQEYEQMATALDTALADLQAKVAANTQADSAAEQLISGIPALITTAVNSALAAGATPAQLQMISDLGNKLATDSGALAAAVVAGTPVGPPAASTRKP